jgi:DNA-binding beta-propeller fold protein YncE
MKRNRLALTLVMALIAGAVAARPASAQTAPDYKLAGSVSLGAPDRWDYVFFDPGSHRVFVAHGDRVSVVDGRDGTVLGQVAGIPGGTHGIAIRDGNGLYR